MATPKKLDQLTNFSNNNRMPKAKHGKSIKKRIKAERGLTLADQELDKQFRDENSGMLIQAAPMPKGIGAQGQYMDQMFQSENVQKGKMASVLNNPRAAKYMNPVAPSIGDLQRIDGSFTVPKTKPKEKRKFDYVGMGLATIPGIVNNLFPDDPNRQYIRPEDTPYYNPYPQGTGSQAIMKKGGMVVSGTSIKFPEGGELVDETPKKSTAPKGYTRRTLEQRQAWNSLLDFAEKKGVAGKPELDDRSKDMSMSLINEYNKVNPKMAIDPAEVQHYQYELGAINQGTFPQLVTSKPEYADIWSKRMYSDKHNEKFINKQRSQPDNWFGSLTSQQYYPQYEFVSDKKKVNYGVDYDKYAEAIYNEQQKQSVATKFRTGGQLRQNEYEQGGEMALYDDRTGAQPISDNPYSSEIVEFKGPSHEEGGIPMSYTGKQVEVEGGETAFKDMQGNLQILGNMKNPLTGRLFKNDGKLIAKEERKADNQMAKGNNLVEKSDPNDPFERLTFNSGKAKMQGADAKMKRLATIREAMATVQQQKLQLADELGLKPLDLDKAKYGKMIKAANGEEITPFQKELRQNYEANQAKKRSIDPEPSLGVSIDPDTLLSLKQAIWAAEGKPEYGVPTQMGGTAFGKYQFIKSTRKGYYDKNKDVYKKEFGVNNFEEFETAFKANKGNIQEDVMNRHVSGLYNKFKDPKAVLLAHRLGEGAANQMMKTGKATITTANGTKKTISWDDPIAASYKGEKETVNDYIKRGGIKPQNPTQKSAPPAAPSVDTPVEREPYEAWKPIGAPKTPPRPSYIDFNGGTNPTMRAIQQGDLSSDAQGLNPAGLAGEAFTLLTERVDPVLMQKYRPELEQPFQYSFQDQASAVDDTYRAALMQNTRNPSVQAALAAQASQQKRGVYADEFRFNQGESARVYNQNRQIMNDAQLKNLGIADQQYVRQSQARSNTKQNRFNALSSISEKYLQNQREQNELKVYENMYKYRYNNDYKIGYEGSQQQFNTDMGIAPLSQTATTQPTTSGGKRDFRIPVSNKAVANAVGLVDFTPLSPSLQRKNANPSFGATNDIIHNYTPQGYDGEAKRRGLPKRQSGGSITREFKSFK